MAAIVGAGVVGLIDDWIKVAQRPQPRAHQADEDGRAAHRRRRASPCCVLVQADVSTHLSFTRVDSLDIDLGAGRCGCVFAVLLFARHRPTRVNLTDGLDGLAAGSASFSFGAYVVIGVLGVPPPERLRLPQALDLALVAAAMVGACAGFLWWNAAPARIIMGDTGALAIGAGLAALALVTNTHLLLPIIGGIFVIETLSVIDPGRRFRLFHRRVFRMAPIHHHFELLGWPETTVIIRFWILAGLSHGAGARHLLRRLPVDPRACDRLTCGRWWSASAWPGSRRRARCLARAAGTSTVVEDRPDATRARGPRPRPRRWSTRPTRRR